jgi:predicted DNA-binding transcriptional regulator AlpA
MVVQLSTDELRAIIRDEVQATLKAIPHDDKLLTVAEVSEILNCNEEWVYHNARKLPFVRKVGGMLRFSSNGLQRYIESKKFTST